MAPHQHRFITPFRFPLSSQTISCYRSSILELLKQNDNGFKTLPVSSIQQSTLHMMRDYVDQLFLNNYLFREYGALPITLSSRMTSGAGKFVYSRQAFLRDTSKAEIRMSGDFLMRLQNGPFYLNGLVAKDPQEAFLIVFEHEVIHAIEYALYGSTGHSSRFLSLANGIFGHTGIRHELPTRTQEAAACGISRGSYVSFPYQGKMVFGIVSYVGKKATVMVADRRGAYIDSKGHTYSKYRVPLNLLSLNR